MRVRTFFGWIACLILLAGLGAWMALRSYRVFTHEELVAKIECEPAPKGGTFSSVIWYTPMERGIPGPSLAFEMHGDQWAIGGDILKWHSWLNWMGIRSCHKITRLSGRYWKVEDELAKPHSAYALNGGTDLFWRGLYRFGRWVPFVEAVYGNSAYTLAQPGSTWGVYVTLSGYLVKPLSASGVPAPRLPAPGATGQASPGAIR